MWVWPNLAWACCAFQTSAVRCSRFSVALRRCRRSGRALRYDHSPQVHGRSRDRRPHVPVRRGPALQLQLEQLAEVPSAASLPALAPPSGEQRRRRLAAGCHHWAPRPADGDVATGRPQHVHDHRVVERFPNFASGREAAQRKWRGTRKIPKIAEDERGLNRPSGVLCTLVGPRVMACWEISRD